MRRRTRRIAGLDDVLDFSRHRRRERPPIARGVKRAGSQSVMHGHRLVDDGADFDDTDRDEAEKRDGDGDRE